MKIDLKHIYFEHGVYRSGGGARGLVAERAQLVQRRVRALQQPRHQRRLAVEVWVLGVYICQLDRHEVLHLQFHLDFRLIKAIISVYIFYLYTYENDVININNLSLHMINSNKNIWI